MKTARNMSGSVDELYRLFCGTCTKVIILEFVFLHIPFKGCQILIIKSLEIVCDLCSWVILKNGFDIGRTTMFRSSHPLID